MKNKIILIVSKRSEYLNIPENLISKKSSLHSMLRQDALAYCGQPKFINIIRIIENSEKTNPIDIAGNVNDILPTKGLDYSGLW